MQSWKLLLSVSALALASGLAADGKPIHGGGPSGAAPASITDFKVGNTSAGTVSNQPVTLLLPLGPSAMTSGQKFQITKNDGTTVLANAQQDACASWKQNGNEKLCAVSFIEPDSITAGSNVIYQAHAVSGSPVTTPNVSKANITANTNFVFKTSFNLVPDSGTGTAETGTWDLMDVNYVLSNACTQWNNSTGYGTDPACGWDVVASGPSKYGLHLFMYAKRESDNAIHKWIRTDMWVDFWGSGSTPCPCSTFIKVGMPNVYGPLASGTVGSAGGGYALGADLYNGATRIPVNFGGPNDGRGAVNVTFDHTLVDPWFTQGEMIFPGGSWVTNSSVAGQMYGIAFGTSGGTLPTGLVAGKPYFINLQCRSINNCANFSTTKYGIYNWQTTQIHCPIDGNNVTHCDLGGSTYSNPLTNDGTCASNCSAYPVVMINPWNKVAMAGTDGARIWIGANGLPMTAPPIAARENFTYLTQTTHAVPPYITNLEGNFPAQSGMTRTGTPLYYPNSGFLWGDYNTGGDDPGDARIGQIDNPGAIALFAPFDVTAVANSKVYAAGMEQLRGFFIDEHTGVLPVLNNGHAKNGTTYAHMGSVNSTIYNTTAGGGTTGFPIMVAGVTGAGYWGGAGDIPFVNRYQPVLEPSHMPLPAQAPYLLTGLPEYLDQMQSEANGVTSGVQASTAVGGVTYYHPLSPAGVEQTRGIAWGRRIKDQADYYTPDTDVAALYLSDLVADDYGFDAGMINNPGSMSGGFPVGGATSYESALGFYWNDVRPVDQYSTGQIGHGEFQPWMDDYVFQVSALEKLRGEHNSDGVTTFINYFQKFAFGRMDSNQGGCLWAGAVRTLNPFAPLTTFDNYFDFTTLPADWNTLYTHASQGSHTFQGTLVGNTLTVTGYGTYGSAGVVPGNAGFAYPGGSMIIGPGVPANTIVVSGGNPYTVSGAGGNSSGPFVTEYAGEYYGLLNIGGSNPGAPPWAGCAANSLTTPIVLDSVNSAAATPTSLINIAAGTLAYASWLGLAGATADYNFYRNVQYLGTNPDTNHNTGTSIPLSFFTYPSSSGTSSNAMFAIGAPGATYP